jgi:flagellar protein FlaI
MAQDIETKKGFRNSLRKLFRRKKPAILPPPPRRVLPKGHKIIERYPLNEPFAHAAIAQNPTTGEFKYLLDELQLDIMEQDVYDRILEILLAEIASPEEEIEDPRQFFVTEAEKIVSKYRISLGWLPDVSWSKIL